MNLYRRSGLATGVLFIAATAAGVLSLSAQRFVAAPDYLRTISANEPAVLLSALLILVMGWAGAGIGIAMYPVLRRHDAAMAFGAASFRVIEAVFDCVGALLLLMMVSLSREFMASGQGDGAQFQRLGTLLLEGRRWVSSLLALPSWCIGAYLYYSLFYRARLVPRCLSLWGLAGITLTMIASALVLSNQLASESAVQLLLNLPIALQEMVLAVWLIARGFNPSAAVGPEA